MVAVSTEEEIGSPIANRFVRCYILSDVCCILCLVSTLLQQSMRKRKMGRLNAEQVCCRVHIIIA